MATLQARRGGAVGNEKAGGPPVVMMPLIAAQTMVEGDLCITSSSSVDFTTSPNATTTKIRVGFGEKTYSTAPATGQAYPVTLILPGYLYELSANSGSGAAFTSYGTVDNAKGAVLAISNVTDLAFRTIVWPGEVNGYFETNRFIAKTATSETAGAVNQPSAPGLGLKTDTMSRVQCIAVATTNLFV